MKRSIRAFLNPPSSYHTGSIECVTDSDDYNGKLHHDNEIIIRDCDRTIKLNFFFKTKAEKKARIKKLDKMVEVLVKYRGMLEEQEV